MAEFTIEFSVDDCGMLVVGNPFVIKRGPFSLTARVTGYSMSGEHKMVVRCIEEVTEEPDTIEPTREKSPAEEALSKRLAELRGEGDKGETNDNI